MFIMNHLLSLKKLLQIKKKEYKMIIQKFINQSLKLYYKNQKYYILINKNKNNKKKIVMMMKKK